MMFNKKRKNILENIQPANGGLTFTPRARGVSNNFNIPETIHPIDRQNNYINLVKKQGFKFREAVPVPAISNQEGLARAYTRPNSLYIHGNVLHVAGTQMGRINRTYRDGQLWSDAVQDVWDDLKIPPRLTGYSLRYKDAEEVLNNNPNITHLNGHSLGGAVVMQLQKDKAERNFTVTTYGAPTISMTPASDETQRFRNPGDPISILDRGTRKTEQSKGSKNPFTAHSFANFNHTSETNNNGWVYDDKFVPKPQYNAPMAPMAIPQTQSANADDATGGGWIMSAKPK